VIPVLRAWTSRASVGSWVLGASVLLVAAIAPFERPLPVAVPGFTLTTVELAVLAALALGALTVRRDPSAFEWRTPITLPLVAVVSCAIVATLAAPEFRANSLRVVGRLGVAVLLFLLVANVATSTRLARQLIATLLGAAALVGAIAVLELAQLPWVLDGLKLFRPGFHVVGGQLRATSTLFYPTITSMYLEVAFALGLICLSSLAPPEPPHRAKSARRGPREAAPKNAVRLAFGALVLAGAGIIATFTRAGLITMALSLLTYGGIMYFRRRSLGEGGRRLAALAVILVILVFVSRSPRMLVTRMSTEGSQDWYGASYDVPKTLTLTPESFNDIPVTLSNRGRIAWQSAQAPVFALSYHWLSIDTEEIVIYDGLRTPFAQPVEPGDDVKVMARVRAPGYPGSYLLVWDVVQEHRTWLSLEGVFPGRTIATVEGAAVGSPLPTRGRMPGGVMRMPRTVLWQTALQMSAEHPLLGIGPDNFRHTYGRYLGLAAWDTRVHSNNTYLEVQVGMGTIGLLAVTWLAIAAIGSTWRLIRGAPESSIALVAAATAACLAIAVHGVVDSFLTFTPTYVVFAIAAGLLFRPSALSAPSTFALRATADRSVAHAHRV